MSNKAKIREEAKKLLPIDDVMFRKMAEEKDFCQEILRVIMKDPDLLVLDNTPQYVVTNLQGRSVILEPIMTSFHSRRRVNVDTKRLRRVKRLCVKSWRNLMKKHVKKHAMK